VSEGAAEDHELYDKQQHQSTLFGFLAVAEDRPVPSSPGENGEEDLELGFVSALSRACRLF
jgi:hypothetical protein